VHEILPTRGLLNVDQTPTVWRHCSRHETEQHLLTVMRLFPDCRPRRGAAPQTCHIDMASQQPEHGRLIACCKELHHSTNTFTSFRTFAGTNTQTAFGNQHHAHLICRRWRELRQDPNLVAPCVFSSRGSHCLNESCACGGCARGCLALKVRKANWRPLAQVNADTAVCGCC
jgi:hypothetical protein